MVTAETPGFRLLCDILQAEIDNTIGALESFTLTAAEETRLLAFMRAYRRILFHFKNAPRQIQLALRKEVDPESTAALFTPGVSDLLDIDAPQEDPLAPVNFSSSPVVVE